MLRTYVQSMTGKINPAIPPVRTYMTKPVSYTHLTLPTT